MSFHCHLECTRRSCFANELSLTMSIYYLLIKTEIKYRSNNIEPRSNFSSVKIAIIVLQKNSWSWPCFSCMNHTKPLLSRSCRETKLHSSSWSSWDWLLVPESFVQHRIWALTVTLYQPKSSEKTHWKNPEENLKLHHDRHDSFPPNGGIPPFFPLIYFSWTFFLSVCCC